MVQSKIGIAYYAIYLPSYWDLSSILAALKIYAMGPTGPILTMGFLTFHEGWENCTHTTEQDCSYSNIIPGHQWMKMSVQPSMKL